MSDPAGLSERAGSKTLVQALLDHTNAAARGLPPKQAQVLWRNMIARFPDEPKFAVRLVYELLLTESWTELAQFGTNAASYVSPELDLRLIEVALARGEVATCESLIADFVRAHGNTAELAVRHYELCLLQRKFAEAKAIAKGLAVLLPNETTRAVYLADRAGYLGDLHSDWSLYPQRASDFDVYVINLDADTVRLKRIQEQLKGTAFTRIPGVRGAYLPDTVLRNLTRNQGNMQKGTVGCFLSHMVAWERVVASGRPGFVIEDDAWLLAGVPPSMSSMGLPASFDLVFANERMSPVRSVYPEVGFKSVPIGAAARTKNAEWSAVGTDGYFVSPRGAKKLLAMVERDGVAGDVDWRLLSYALTERQRASVRKAGGFAANAIAFHEDHRSSARRLKALVLSPAIVRQFLGGSVRMWDNQLPHSHMAVVRKIRAKREKLLT